MPSQTNALQCGKRNTHKREREKNAVGPQELLTSLTGFSSASPRSLSAACSPLSAFLHANVTCNNIKRRCVRASSAIPFRSSRTNTINSTRITRELLIYTTSKYRGPLRRWLKRACMRVPGRFCVCADDGDSSNGLSKTIHQSHFHERTGGSNVHRCPKMERLSRWSATMCSPWTAALDCGPYAFPPPLALTLPQTLTLNVTPPLQLFTMCVGTVCQIGIGPGGTGV